MKALIIRAILPPLFAASLFSVTPAAHAQNSDPVPLTLELATICFAQRYVVSNAIENNNPDVAASMKAKSELWLAFASRELDMDRNGTLGALGGTVRELEPLVIKTMQGQGAESDAAADTLAKIGTTCGLSENDYAGILEAASHK